MSTLVTDRAAFCRAARPGVRVPVEVCISVEDPFIAYRCARTGDDDGVYLETTGGQDGWGYFAVEPIDRVSVGPEEAGALEALVDRLEEETLLRGACDVPYPCGAFGWLSYDIVRELESIPESTADERRLPRLEIGIYDRVAAWTADPEDEAVDLRITACPRVDPDESPETAYRRGRNRALALVRAIDTGDPTVESPPLRSETVQFESDCGRAAFTERVRRIETARTDEERVVMGVRHRKKPHAGVQFHPESILTDAGRQMIETFCQNCLEEERCTTT